MTAPTDTARARAVHPEHFGAALRHAAALEAAGMPRSLLALMARWCAGHGLTDAAAGYEHTLLAAHCGAEEDPCRP